MAQEIAWGSAPARAGGGLLYFARHPVTRKPHPLAPGKRWTILLDGEDVTSRTREADAEKGEVILLVPNGKSSQGRTIWKIDRERKCVATELRQGRVEIRYDWPENADAL